MVSKILLLTAAAVGFLVFSIVNGWRSNLQKARKTGLPYVVVPCSPYNLIWQITYKFWVFFITLLPKHMWEGWLFIMLPEWGFRTGQTHFERIGDTFLIVAPGSLAVVSQSPEAIHQVTSRREHFPKATFLYTILELFGRNILTTEGAVWRLHRKATSASFNEKNAAYTFAEAIHQAQGMVAKWTETAQSDSPTITTIEKDTMTLALNIIGYVGFGLRFTWPGEPLPADTDPRMRKYGSHTPPPGHTLTFATSVEVVLHHILMLLIMPRWLMRVLALFMKAPRDAYEANGNYVRYMSEFLSDKIASVKEGSRGGDSMDLMGQLVRGRYEDEKAATKRENALTDDEIIGNAFIMLVAGHETTANALHFTLVELANNPASQRALQADVDRLLGCDTDPTTWDYEASINGMLASMLGAAMNETLRLMPPVVNVPKWVSPQADQPLALKETGQTHVLPAGADVVLSVVSVHRHPKYWPTADGQGPHGHGQASDLDNYIPERWFQTEDGGGGGGGNSTKTNQKDQKDADIDGADTEDYGGFSGPDTSAQLYRPVRGSFVPFSDGPRSCLGRRIAQVEMLAALAVLFQRYSIELAVDAWADDKAVAAMGEAARRTLYKKAQARSRETLRTATSTLTLKLHGTAAVPVRLVPRGQERFVHCVDA